MSISISFLVYLFADVKKTTHLLFGGTIFILSSDNFSSLPNKFDHEFAPLNIPSKLEYFHFRSLSTVDNCWISLDKFDKVSQLVNRRRFKYSQAWVNKSILSKTIFKQH